MKKNLLLFLIIVSIIISVIIYMAINSGNFDKNYKIKQRLKELNYDCSETKCTLDDIHEISNDDGFFNYGYQYSVDFEEKKYSESYVDLRIDYTTANQVLKAEKIFYNYYWEEDKEITEDMIFLNEYYVYNCKTTQIYFSKNSHLFEKVNSFNEKISFSGEYFL